ncbi:hypothetical protein H257_18469 [Aphanomyces astaci]|uniref:RxLR effector protein n=1 Tax=Aphanomyces astaci TaxID=112090 RepID=W4FCY8_APHAT|nr:hypothetical protein H257_18469 [Aphanomyces astaci]ETV64691.1 hypothetical protein H257_18469 [Aphanomyces astaci]|eukprot:XP_009845826.1 hypothetical protein H257_18469 [Aphanomyces astaci]
MKTIAILALASSAATFVTGDTAASVQGIAPTPSIRSGGTEILEVLGRFPELVKEFDVKTTATQGDKDVNTDTQGDKDVSTDTQSGTKILEVLGRFPDLVKEFDVKTTATQGDKDVNTDTQGDKDVNSTDAHVLCGV